MNRRWFLSRFVPGVVTGAITVPLPSRPERPLTITQPHCPRCGAAAAFLGPWDTNPNILRTVTCGCGWTGEAKLFHTIPED